MTFDEACRVLGVRLKGLTENEVRLAFSSAVKLAHPDVGGGYGGTAQNMQRLRDAKYLLLKLVEEKPYSNTSRCEACKGKGTVAGTSRFGAMCKACGGRGVVR